MIFSSMFTVVESVPYSSHACVNFISHYFHKRYGDCVAYALQDFRSPNEFKECNVDIDCSSVYGDVWLSQSFDEMCLKLA